MSYEEYKFVTAKVRNDKYCSLGCRFLKKDKSGFSCILFDKKLVFRERGIQRTKDCLHRTAAPEQSLAD